MIPDSLHDFLGQHRQELVTRTLEHVELVALALLAAVAIGMPLAIALRRIRPLSASFIGLASVVQTVPSLALLSLMLPLFGLGRNSAVAALFLYALLPIIRNTLVGLDGVSATVVDTARGMGMSRFQLFWSVELPLALPTIFAGLRTAAVISVGVATLSALVGAGGLGVFIFRGVANNQPLIILLGALPAALLALVIDALLALAERTLLRHTWRVAVTSALMLAGVLFAVWRPVPSTEVMFGFPAGFVQRPDGYETWRNHYQIPAVRHTELDINLLYNSLRTGEIDVACGSALDSRVESLGLRVIADDGKIFPHYDAALLARQQILQRIPALRPLLDQLGGALSTATMRQLVRRVEQDGLTNEAVAREFLREWTMTAGIDWQERRALAKRAELDSPDIVIGTRSATSQYIMGRVLEQLIDGATGWNAQLKSGLGSTAICFDSLQRGDIDLYPEFNGMLAVTIFQQGAEPVQQARLRDGPQLNAWLKSELARHYRLEWMTPFGFSNTYTFIVRTDDPRFENVQTMSQLAELIRR
jgi:osmoprotectant transport system permease protein